MDDNEKKFMNPVPAREKLNVMKGIAESRRPVVIQKGSGKPVPSQVTGGSEAELRITDVEALQSKAGDVFSFIVVYDNNKYLFTGKAELFEGYLIFDSSVGAKKIQRRENFRAQVLGTSKLDLFVSEYEGNPFNKEFSVLDISFGGCQFEVNGLEMPFVESGTFKGELRGNNIRNPIPVKGIFRRVVKNKEHGFMKVGAQFDAHGRGVEAPLMELIMRCARESQRYQSM